MTVHHASEFGEGAEFGRPTGGWRSAIAWMLGIGGAVATFIGLFILFAGDEQSLGLGFSDDWTWEVSEIATGWGVGFLIGGIAALVILVGMLVTRRR
ncbi:MAG: hypothetical protein ABFR89_09515 [Actinomycetota bacterium]